MNLFVDTFESPIGPVTLATDGRTLVAMAFGSPAELLPQLRARYGAGLRVAEASDPQRFTSRARAYFEGDLGALDEVPVDGGGTRFQRRVWAALREIAPGETASYSAVAVRIGAAGAGRAVGLAAARNPIAVAVPCHRVIGADGRLTGYAGGIERKRWLLEHERALDVAGRIGGTGPSSARHDRGARGVVTTSSRAT